MGELESLLILLPLYSNSIQLNVSFLYCLLVDEGGGFVFQNSQIMHMLLADEF